MTEQVNLPTFTKQETEYDSDADYSSDGSQSNVYESVSPVPPAL